MADGRLSKPLTIGPMHLQHRVGMCPLTRLRASDDHVPLPMVADHYAQRSCVPGTLLVSEATLIAPEDGGMPNVPGIYSRAQVDAWRRVTDAVHARGCYILCQLWSLGRAAKPDVADKEGFAVVSSDEVPMSEGGAVPRRLAVEEIQQRVRNFASAARNAIEAGFDGVEIHGANGYLVDQFTQDTCNRRSDDYGGSIEKRSRFAVEVCSAVCDAVGPERTGIRLSPWSTFQAMRMADPVPQFSDLVRKLSALKLAFLHLVESRVAGGADVEATEKLDFVYHLWDGPLLVAGGLTPDRARSLVDEDEPRRDIVAMFGRHFISTPDLAFRVQEGLPLTPYNRSVFYAAKSPEGYTDYHFSDEFLAQRG